MAETWWRINNGWGVPPKPVSVERCTPEFCYLTDGHGRSKQISSFDCYFPSFEEAIAFEEAQLKLKVEVAQRKLEAAEARLAEFRCAVKSREGL